VCSHRVYFSTPAALTLTYDVKNVGIDYDRSLFGIKLADCRQLARALERTETLTYLDLSSNNMDDDKVRMIASGLVDNVSVTNLNLSHNKVGVTAWCPSMALHSHTLWLTCLPGAQHLPNST
jgi:hypothetical protein